MCQFGSVLVQIWLHPSQPFCDVFLDECRNSKVRMIQKMKIANQKPISNTKLGWWMLFGISLILFSVGQVRAQESCITTQQYYNGLVDTGVVYCELETQIAAKKFNKEFVFSADENEILLAKYNYLRVIHAIPKRINSIEVFDLTNMGLEFATLNLHVSSGEMREEHHVMLIAYLVLVRTETIETFFNVDLPEMHNAVEALIKGGTEYVGFEGRADAYVDCYWRIFVPGRKGLETVSSKIFKECLLEEGNGR